jgi:glycosyltransferase involved in cell wall biosynthesis
MWWGLNDRLRADQLIDWVEAVQRDRGPIDVVHGHFFSGSGYLPIVRRKTGIPYVITEHSSRLTARSADHKQLSPAGLRMAVRAYADAAKVIAPSEYLKGCIEAIGLPGDIEVVPNPVDTDSFRAPAASTADVARIVSVGRLEDDKDPSTLMRAFAVAASSEPRLRLDLIGDGPDRSKVEALVESLGLRSRVTLYGTLGRAEVAEKLVGATAFVLASRVETFCVAAAEALCCGIPVVMPAVGAIPEMVGDRDGILVRPGDASGLADGMVRVATGGMAVDRQAIALRARSRLGSDAVARQLRTLYDSVLETRTPRIGAAMP